MFTEESQVRVSAAPDFARYKLPSLLPVKYKDAIYLEITQIINIFANSLNTNKNP